ncbi:DNA repair protein RadC [Dechloromonas sp. TW-R-39-2]|uniref:RadC family protein n=1 Tax=Dechloromonas sp. TW-R-39-2 TaxID=2654218 RepID=UPI00193DB487|nr:DNA repair protein RadC [Dechloromonas sp. TW-R-39-2]QRM19078.1 DNA repair protein RadC [Dechloromonas sp. TW-R-39-2]
MAITDWPAGERPRERLLSHGPEALSDAELLAIYLRVGVRGKSAVDLARDLLLRFDGNLNALAEATPAQLSSVSGIGIAKAVQLKASFELTRRALTQEMVKRDSFSSPGQVRDWLRLKLANRQHEVFMALWLDAQNRLLRADELFTGSLTQTSVYPREVVKTALAHNAAAVILAHNHPSGVAEPSRADELLTKNLKDALAMVDIKLLDHFIVAGNQAPISFAERGLI